MAAVRESLNVSDPLYNVPWQNFVLNSSIILGITFSVPVCINMLMHSFRPDSKFDPELFNFSRMAPWACAATLLAGLLLDRYNTRVQKFFRESSRLHVCCRPARRTLPRQEQTDHTSASQEQPLISSGAEQHEGADLSSRCCTSSELNGLPWRMKLLAFSFLPLITWSSTMIWLDGVAEAYVGCAFACHATSHIKEYKDIEFCGYITSFSDMFEAGKAHWPKDRLESSFSTHSPKAVLQICKSIFHSKRTKWVEQMQERRLFFVMFEALLRQHYHISSAEVFGSLLGGVIIVLWLVIDAALSTKTKELVTYRSTFLRQNLMVRASTIEKYAKLFLHLNKLQKGNHQQVTQEYSVKILETAMNGTIGMEKGANVEDEVAKAFAQYSDADGDGADDRAQDQTGWLSWPCFGREFACVLLALVHVSVPAIVKLFLKRRQSLLHKGLTTFLYEEFPSAFLSQMPKLQPALLCNLIVGFVAYYLLFNSLAVAFERYRHKFDQLLAFRCMWRFPDENPLEDVNIGATKMSGCGLLKEIPTLEQEQQRQDVERQIVPYILTRSDDKDTHLLSAGGAAPESWPKLKQRLYRFDFSHRLFRKLFDEVPRLSEWYNMRRYIQIDCVDERIATEMYSTLAVVCLLWKLVMVLINWMSMNNGEGRKLQIVNFESLYDTVVIAVLLLMSLTLTLQFNDEFARHHQQVCSLQEHLKLVHAGDCIKRAKKKQRAEEEAKEHAKAAAEQAKKDEDDARTKSPSHRRLPTEKSKATLQAELAAGTVEESKEEIERLNSQTCQKTTQHP
eukprot:TRINITY_DN8421_c0_g1_i2.p1 TRINITY_DN8421_c0_g1~~TRINITY_DN8421_c0_g1_i2.p1  ORF type:complete len:791 (-),score=110.59 TRINITY_DN8421_c0_g1_i2:342-2714(-)